MASRRNVRIGTRLGLFISSIAMGLLFDASQGTRYTVGDAVWGIPVYPDFYSHWSSSIVLYLGDYLVFEFQPEFSNVLQVPLLDYQECTSSNAVKYLPNSPAIISLNEVGVFYYLCNISDYCRLGQRVTVTVHPRPLGPVASAPLSPPSTQPLSPVPGLVPPVLPPSPLGVAPGGSGVAPSPGVPSGDAPIPGQDVGSNNIGSRLNDYGIRYWAYSALFGAFGLLFFGF